VRELRITARDGRRYDPWLLAVSHGLPTALFTVAAVLKGPVAALLWPGPLLALLLVLHVAGRLGWTRVDASGITTRRLFGAGRTLPWSEVRWVEVHEQYLPKSGTVRNVRVHLTNGRRRRLPGLHTGGLLVDPRFDAKAQAVLAWWQKSAKRSARVAPEPRPRWWRARGHA
jgi:hypothetical protein